MENQLLDTNFEEPIMNHEYAGFWERFGAVFIDGIILAVPSFIISYSFGFSISTIFDAAKSRNMEELYNVKYFIVLVLQAVLGWLYFAYQESNEHQATIGKRVLNLRVTDLDGQKVTFQQASIRYWVKHLITGSSSYSRYLLIPEIASILSLLALANYLIQPFTEKRQALHDIIARTLVYKNP